MNEESTHHHGHAERGYQPTAQEMENRYAATQRLWRDVPNETLVRYAGALSPGTALDIGCGEGADLRWLSDHGWDAYGIDFAPTAVERTRARGLCADVKDFADLGGRAYDLVCCHYGGVPATAQAVALLESLVAPGGLLLYVHHDLQSAEVAMPEWVAANLRELAVVELTRRDRSGGDGGPGHARDVVLLARRDSGVGDRN